MLRRFPVVSSGAGRCSIWTMQRTSAAETDANFVLTGTGGIVEIQATAEGEPFAEARFLEMLGLARSGIAELVSLQTGGVLSDNGADAASWRRFSMRRICRGATLLRRGLGPRMHAGRRGAAMSFSMRRSDAPGLRSAVTRRSRQRHLARAAPWCPGRRPHLLSVHCLRNLDGWRTAINPARDSHRGRVRMARRRQVALYVRDPAGNSVEFAEPRIWGLP